MSGLNQIKETELATEEASNMLNRSKVRNLKPCSRRFIVHGAVIR